MKAEISKNLYDTLIEKSNEGNWAGFQSNVKCKLGAIKKFNVIESDIEFNAKCTQHGGSWSGYYTYVLIKEL